MREIMEYDNIKPNIEVLNHFKDKFKEQLGQLYYGTMYVLPLSVEGEEFLEYLYNEGWIDKYGCNVYLQEYKKELYNVILVNND
jgi:hypothetical protein